MKKKSSFAINAPTYAEGMIFVGLEDGTIQAFDAETLESLWIYEAPRGGQPNCPIAYKDDISTQVSGLVRKAVQNLFAYLLQMRTQQELMKLNQLHGFTKEAVTTGQVHM